MLENEVFEKALTIAMEAHRGQVDKQGMPYILHPIAVVERVEGLELKTIAILHDVIEDTEVTGEFLIENGIPKEIVEVVELLSKPKGEGYETYLRRVKKNKKALMVKKADLAHNTSPEREKGLNEERREKYKRAKEILDE